MKVFKLKIKNSKSGFTLLELLLVIAIIASLAGIILAALNPAQRLEDANEAMALSAGNDLEKAIKVYTVENSGVLPTSLSSITTTGIYDICKQGETIGCINLDQLVTGGKISSIPTDTRYATTHTSGYKINYNTSTTEARVYSQSEYESSTNYCPPGDTCNGPIGEWLFDEGSGNVAINTAGNNNGIINSATWANGYEGQALSFDGISDSVVIGNDTIYDFTTSFTLSAWIYPNNTDATKTIFRKDNAYVLYYSTQLDFYNWADNSRLTCNVSNTPVNTWSYVAAVWDGTRTHIYVNGKECGNRNSINFLTNTNNLVIGAYSNGFSNSFSGMIDNPRIYNYARTPAQIAWEYNQGAPIAHWKFDETSGITTSDSSGNNNTGTLTNGPTWVSGKYGNAVSLDGTNDYISVGDPVSGIFDPQGNSFSLSSWVKTTSTYKYLIGKAYGANTNGDYYLFININGKLQCGAVGASSSKYRSSLSSVNNNIWNHVTCVFNLPGNVDVYINGILDNGSISGANISGMVNTTEPFLIGTGEINRVPASTYAINGQIDDVRYYNYTLTPSQVMQAMHER